ncbi:DNA polymerase III subunit beta [Xanthobacter aminoxidans]|nr:DNA polymerase III subunit beta [Xanthobacter aminoxidans]MCL8382079.1 DNA polymerase III subunit beta [Xanthobacter aminoxidans]
MQTAHLPRASLRAALASIIKAVPRKDPMPILSTVLIEERDGAVTIRATDLDAEVSAIVDGATATAGFAACLPAHQLRDAEKNAPGAEDAAITVDGSGAVAAFGALTVRMVSREPQDFPRIPEPVEPVAFTIPRAALREALAATEFAISTEETRYYLNGVFMQPRPAPDFGDALRFVSTDGHRMAVHDCGVRNLPEFEGVIIRRDTVALLLPLLKAKGAPAAVVVRFSRQRIEFTCGAVVVRSKLIDGTFPDYGRCVPRADVGNTRATFNRRAMIEAIKAVATIKGKRGSAVGLSFADGQAKLWASSEDGGAESSIPCEVSGTPLDIGFNGRYLLDIFGAMNGDVVTIEMHDAGAPARIEEPDGTLYVLMPMRVGFRPAKPATMAAPAPEANAAPAATVVVEVPPVPAVTTAPALAEPVTAPTPHAPPIDAPAPAPSAIVVPFPRAKAAPVPPAPAGAEAAPPVRLARAVPPSASGAAFGRERRSIGTAAPRQAVPPRARIPADGVSCGGAPPTEATSHAGPPPTEATRCRAAAARLLDERTRLTAAPPRRVVRLGSGQVVTLGTYVAAWRRARAAPPDARFRGSPCGWAGAEEKVAEILRQFRAGMDDRINQHLPWFGRGRRWGPEWQAEASRLARAVNTPRLIVRWAPPEFRARLAHRIEDAA